jgi:hypothetical protein
MFTFVKSCNMKRVLLLLLLVLCGFLAWKYIFNSTSSKREKNKLQPVAMQKNTAHFNIQLDMLMQSYMKMQDGLINGNIEATKQSAMDFSLLLDSIPMNELKNDAVNIAEAVQFMANDMKLHVNEINKTNDLKQMRHSFSALTELLYPGFLKMVNYEGKQIYVFHCSMAFGNDVGAHWLNYDKDSRNPYHGKDWDAYTSDDLKCSQLKDSIIQ